MTNYTAPTRESQVTSHRAIEISKAELDAVSDPVAAWKESVEELMSKGIHPGNESLVALEVVEHLQATLVTVSLQLEEAKRREAILLQALVDYQSAILRFQK